ncbi:uncharacterized protein [Rutidosis leptorrhynchoides]|uniref:uncharacterized protein n=1 Tax=Rutidosis leptorrhynchoides TaxID=125765 RepID=UPI003A999C40
MKALLKDLSTLIAPIAGETLILYLAVSKEAISSVLVAERGDAQMPIYFISKALSGSELNYLPIEKLIYALVVTSRRLRRYFQAHSITVLTDQPIRQLLYKPEISGRLTKWVIDLGEHEIAYCYRSAIKGQVMADYLAETATDMPVICNPEQLPAPSPELRELYTNGAASSEGAGAGLILTGPHQEEHTYALRFNFKVTNNEEEYEALLAGMCIARELGVEKLQAYVDSQLVANQINGTFDANDKSMQSYLALVHSLADTFADFRIMEQVFKKSTEPEITVASVEEEEATWMTDIIEFLWAGSLPEEEKEATKIRVKALNYELRGEILYRKSYLGASLHCVGPKEAATIIDEIHKGSCGLHSGSRTVTERIKRLGFGIPNEIVSDNGTQFEGNPFRSWFQDLNIKQCVTSVAHPQANGECEVTNRDIVHAIKARLGMKHSGWVDELPKVLWAHRTTQKNSTGEISFSLVYGSEAVIPAEITVPTERTLSYSEGENDVRLRTNMNYAEERKEMAAIREATNKQRIAKYYDKRVRARTYKVGDLVWRNNQASRAQNTGKLGPNWEGPYKVIEISNTGAYKLAELKDNPIKRTWHATALKKCYM